MRKLATATGIISIAFIAWVIISWFNVISHNLDASPTYAVWNFFTIIF
jgi:hypothetical protein